MVEDQSSDEFEELQAELKNIQQEIESWEFRRIMNGPDDERDTIIAIHAGAGGTESADWASMLLRMYLRFFERKGYSAEVIDLQPGEQTGVKSATVEVRGEYSYGYLKSESGVHRLVRISPFDASSRRHTSFASVFVYPQIEESDEIEINQGDLRIDTFRASGPGGQHVNKTDSAIRITHIPTGIVVTCQSERSQHRNRESAMKYLMAKLLKTRREQDAEKRKELESTKEEIAWGAQIRSYVLHPYNMVKDHRTAAETSNTQAVLDGDLDIFVASFLQWSTEKK